MTLSSYFLKQLHLAHMSHMTNHTEKYFLCIDMTKDKLVQHKTIYTMLTLCNCFGKINISYYICHPNNV